MRTLTRKEQNRKGWSIRLIVSRQEEQEIKMKAIKKGMSISEYIKQAALEGFLAEGISIKGKPQ